MKRQILNQKELLLALSIISLAVMSFGVDIGPGVSVEIDDTNTVVSFVQSVGVEKITTYNNTVSLDGYNLSVYTDSGAETNVNVYQFNNTTSQDQNVLVTEISTDSGENVNFELGVEEGYEYVTVKDGEEDETIYIGSGDAPLSTNFSSTSDGIVEYSVTTGLGNFNPDFGGQAGSNLDLNDTTDTDQSTTTISTVINHTVADEYDKVEIRQPNGSVVSEYGESGTVSDGSTIKAEINETTWDGTLTSDMSYEYIIYADTGVQELEENETFSSNTLQLSWGSADRANHYEVYRINRSTPIPESQSLEIPEGDASRCAAEDENWECLGTVQDNDQDIITFIDANPSLVPGSFTYRVVAINPAGRSPPSNPVTTNIVSTPANY